jgi:hypothetical protein
MLRLIYDVDFSQIDHNEIISLRSLRRLPRSIGKPFMMFFTIAWSVLEVYTGPFFQARPGSARFRKFYRRPGPARPGSNQSRPGMQVRSVFTPAYSSPIQYRKH